MIIFVAGIDTDVGKTVATGRLAAVYAAAGRRVITQKLVQTGCEGIAEDILEHRRAMQYDLLPEDLAGSTCPYVFKFPASPHLAAALEGRRIDTAKLTGATNTLARHYEIVLVEGAGGLCVPLDGQTTLLDLLARQHWPTVLVTTPRLGSINHTLLSLAALRERRIPVAGIVYNLHHPSPPEIVDDTLHIIRDALRTINHRAPVLHMPTAASGTTDERFVSGAEALLAACQP
ncbi:dethiobiotin synthase [Desulfonatronum sp. SC1]|uniref:dethiobiotin synthase n=1 Tax=Desulfonatronum sp. SC1 TaxID=2109626 RepID=UPI000D323CB5|nr:dethiobiotin synthase [Desulfonatronum sp. SC1]PTN36995.1 dethiobiotin synthase [Desulfonatronum sp. SC1]